MEKLGAVIVAGGASRRMGTPKARLLLNGVPLLQLAVDACAECAAVVVVAPDAFADLLTLDPRVSFTREEPAGSGPAAGLVAGLRALPSDADAVQLLACDLPRAAELVAALSATEWPPDADALVPIDAEGWPQFLSARYRADALRSAVAPFGDAREISIRRLLAGVRHEAVELDPGLLLDVDDPAAAAAAGIDVPPPAGRGRPDKE
ncbi:NTP transferase domain-containing protein [Aestuariimicrobium sp. p3-SID1156]|uniref:molybdenum cofactor guanylyltransferase n=1 Tax=Aestuariimicrobium sp. p3-SID1156 TaxID=2916038 RepID=UPI00223C4621|nr:NTP transferase domain-containing protein [Aestuariimicrobium sp. p3-SID1156]MCT1457972.1 NTP transferase domain-containing protein [Aestuariimicrobium sp. p3-SID1156]